MAKLVSVIIPTYNRLSVIRAIESVRQQTLGMDKIKIIVIDDNSDTSYYTALKDYIGQHEDPIELYKNVFNSGPGYCRNKFLENCSERYVYFLDSDDCVSPNALERMVDCADKTSSDVVVVKRKYFNGKVPFQNVFDKNYLGVSLYETNAFQTLGAGGKLVRTRLIANHSIRFAESRRWGEDQPFMAKAYLVAERISVLSDDAYLLLDTDELSLSTSNKKLSNYIETAVEVIDIIDKFGVENSDVIPLKMRVFREHILFFMANVLLSSSGLDKVSLSLINSIMNTKFNFMNDNHYRHYTNDNEKNIMKSFYFNLLASGITPQFHFAL
jgi:glycosyltransferase involved in cell wall biosynthesis